MAPQDDPTFDRSHRVPLGQGASWPAARRAAWILVFGLAIATAPTLSAPSRASGAEGQASVHGRVALSERGLLGATRAVDDGSGVLIYLTGFETAPPAEPAVLDQRGQQFSPRLLPVVVGQEVVFPNRDPIYHNVFSVSPVRPFDLGQYRDSDPPRRQVFPEPGLVPVYCNIHPEMISYVVVLPNAAFTVTGPDGRFALPPLPEGVALADVEVHAWTPGAKRVSARPVVGQPLELQVRRTERVGDHKRKDGTDYPPPGYQEDE